MIKKALGSSGAFLASAALLFCLAALADAGGAGQEFFHQGVAALKAGQPGQAIDKFTQALKADPDLVEAYINRGIAHLRLDHFREAVKDFDQALELAPDSAEALYNRGLAFSRQGLYGSALEDYSRALKYAPGDWQIYYNRGNTYLDLGRGAEALADYHRALQYHQSPEIYHNRGLAYLHLGLADKALADFDKTLAANPNYARAYYNQARALEKLGRKREARVAYRQFLQSGNPAQDAALLQQALDRLQRLEGQ